jgi:hypothetical protein
MAFSNYGSGTGYLTSPVKNVNGLPVGWSDYKAPVVVNTPAPSYGPVYNGPSAPASGGSNSGGGNSGGGGPSSNSSEDDRQAQEQAQIEQYYGLANDQVKGQIKSLKNSENDIYKTATSPYDQQSPLIQQAGQQGLGAIANQQSQAGAQEQSALAAARRLYSELTQRNVQAFGSGANSSVGQAAGEILGRSAQEQFGNVRNTAGQTQQTLATAARDLNDKMTAQLNSLELQKQQALSQAKLYFRDKLDQLNQDKTLIGQAKANAKLDVLREYNNYYRSLESQSNSLKNTISSTAQAAYNQLIGGTQDFANTTNNQISMAGNAVGNQGISNDNYQAGLANSNVLSGDNGQSGITNQLFGSFLPQPNRRQDQLA